MERTVKLNELTGSSKGPKVSIILATYNRANLIGGMLNSILGQSYKNWECLVVDDGSTDNTCEVVNEAMMLSSNIEYYKRSPSYSKGLAGARNFGLDMAKGDFLIFFDDDDYAHPRLIEICLRELGTSEYGFCHFDKKSFKGIRPTLAEIKNRINHYRIGFHNINDVITNKITMASCTVLWNRKCFQNIRFNELLNYAEEYECYTRIILEGFEGIGIDQTLYYNKKHSKSNTGEFWKGDVDRRSSKLLALKLVVESLNKKGLLSDYLVRHFVQMGIFLKESSMVDFVLAISERNLFFRLKYKLLYNLYPLIRIGYRSKKYIYSQR